jgi:hypothetical protein
VRSREKKALQGIFLLQDSATVKDLSIKSYHVKGGEYGIDANYDIPESS